MSIIRQPAYITKSPISVAIGGTVTAPFPVTPIVPTQDWQYNGALAGTSSGKWVAEINYYGTAIVGPTSFTFSDLEGVTGNFFAGGTPNTLISASAPNLIYVGSAFFSASSSSITSISCPKLKVIGTCTASFGALTSLSLPSLVTVTGATGLSFVATPLTSLDISKLENCGGIGFIANNLTSLNLSSIQVVNGSFSPSLASCTTLTLPPVLGTWKVLSSQVNLSASCGFNQSSVDSLLAHIAYMDGNNGTLLFGSGRTVTITSTSASPSNLGSTTTTGSSFVGVGTTCTVNWTNHGYATGDVLRISGITTLTNANRYAVINVVNPNQFTYTITSQTATGAGTATVVKAGNSAKALVTRGVTLTTN